MTTVSYQHEKLNFKGQLKRFGLQSGLSASFAGVAVIAAAANADAQTTEALGPVLGACIGAAVLGFAIYKMIPVKIIEITVTGKTRVRVQ